MTLSLSSELLRGGRESGACGRVCVCEHLEGMHVRRMIVFAKNFRAREDVYGAARVVYWSSGV